MATKKKPLPNQELPQQSEQSEQANLFSCCHVLQAQYFPTFTTCSLISITSFLGNLPLSEKNHLDYLECL
jgi:hypothetical protein